jgi:DNA repair photolyase
MKEEKRLTGTRQWAPINENCIIGCSNDCAYCYAAKNAVRFGRMTRDEWKVMRYNPNCESHIRKRKGRIMFPTTHDLHMEHADWWMPFLRGLLEKGNDILIVSKPQLKAIALICAELKGYKDQIEFRFTIGTEDDKVRQFWEPNAPDILERVAALCHARMQGFRTSVSMEPLLDFDPTPIITLLDPMVSETFWIGTMNHMSITEFKSEELLWYYRMRAINSLHNITKVYEKFKDDPKVCWKDSIQEMLKL